MNLFTIKIVLNHKSFKLWTFKHIFHGRGGKKIHIFGSPIIRFEATRQLSNISPEKDWFAEFQNYH